MKKIDHEAVADMHFEMKWESADATHTESYDARQVNFWKDCLPEPLWENGAELIWVSKPAHGLGGSEDHS